MKNKRSGFLVILTIAALASSCGTSGHYASSAYGDGIYYRPTAESRAQMIAAQEAQREKERQSQSNQYLARDEDGNLYVVTELLDGETYESRLHKFDSPWYTNSIWYGGWDTPWYNPWWSSYPYYGNSWTWGYAWLDSYYNWGYPYYYGRYNPWYYSWGFDPWYWGAGTYAGWYGFDRWSYHNYYRGYNHYSPGPGPRPDNNGHNVVRTPRNAATGSGMYRSNRASGGSHSMYSTQRSSSGGTVGTRSSGTVRSSGSSRPTRTGASGGGSSTRSSGSYSAGGGSYSGGGGSSSSSSSSSYSGSSSSGGGSHSGGGRR